MITIILSNRLLIEQPEKDPMTYTVTYPPGYFIYTLLIVSVCFADWCITLILIIISEIRGTSSKRKDHDPVVNQIRDI